MTLSVNRACCRYLGLASIGSVDQPGGGSAQTQCGSLTGLVADQLSVCRHSPAAVLSLKLGAELGLHECQFQFQHERWNCSPAAAKHINQSLFDTIVRRGTTPWSIKQARLSVITFSNLIKRFSHVFAPLKLEVHFLQNPCVIFPTLS